MVVRRLAAKPWHQATKPLKESSARALYLEINEQLSTFPMIISIKLSTKKLSFEDHRTADKRTIIQMIIKQWTSIRRMTNQWTIIQMIIKQWTNFPTDL
jgi:hypothetical protein